MYVLTMYVSSIILKKKSYKICLKIDPTIRHLVLLLTNIFSSLYEILCLIGFVAENACDCQVEHPAQQTGQTAHNSFFLKLK